MYKRSYFLRVLTVILVLSLVFPTSALAVGEVAAWCPTGSLPPSGSGCVTSAISLGNLIANLGSSSGAGTVYVASTYSAAAETGDIFFDAATLPNLTNITIQGGWNFSLGTQSGASTISAHGLKIGGFPGGTPWPGNITINNITVLSAPARGINLDTANNKNISLSNITVTSAASGSGIRIQSESTGDVTLTNVTVSSSAGGANGLTVATPLILGNVLITDSSFTSNTGDGLQVFSNASLHLNHVVADSNTNNGLFVYTGLKPDATILIDNSSTFNTNGQSGLNITSEDVSIANVTANNNGVMGASIEVQSPNVSIRNSTFNSNGSTISSPDSASPDGAGLFVENSYGGVLMNITAQSNSGAGLYLNSSEDGINTALPAVGGGFVVSCSLIGGPVGSNGNNFYGIIYNLDDTFHAAPSDGHLELRSVTLTNNLPGPTLGLSGTIGTSSCYVYLPLILR